MNDVMETTDRKNLRKEKIRLQLTRGVFLKEKNMMFAVISSVVFGFIYSFAITAGYSLLNLFLALLVGLILIDILIIRSKEYDKKNLIFWSIIIIIFTSVYFRTTIMYYSVLTSLVYPTLFVTLVLFSKKEKPNIKRYIGQHFAFLANLGQIYNAVSLARNNKSVKYKNILSVLVGVAIAIFALLIILPIMSDADIFFKGSIKNLLDYTTDIEISSTLWKIILGVFFTMCGFGFIYTGLVKNYNTEKTVNIPQINKVIIITILSIIGAAYLLFIFTQVNYLFITNMNWDSIDMSYSEYARSGFFEMVWLSAINIIIILSCMVFYNSSNQNNKTLKVLMMYFNMVNLYMLIVSFYKMFLYQNEFGFTEKRILVYVYIIFQLLVLSLLATKIFKNDFKFWLVLLYVSSIFWGTLTFINIQSLSFKLNVKRYEQTGEIETKILSTYNFKDASNAAKDFYFEYKDALSQEQLNDIVYYFSATNMYTSQDFIKEKQKIIELVEERFLTHDVFQVNIQNSIFARNAEMVLLDYYKEFIAK